MRALVLLNAFAGTVARKGAPGGVALHVREALERVGIKADVQPVRPDCIAAERRRARAPEFETVIAGGGDGTVNSVASLLAGSDKPLGVLPLGTLNHFAKALGMPLPLDEAAAALAAGSARAVDVGEVNGAVFVNNASIGLYPHVVGKREELLRRLGGNKWVALAFASLSVFRRYPTLRVCIRGADGRQLTCNTPFIFVGNNPYQISLLALGERPCLDRGKLGLYIATRSGRFALLRLAVRALLGRLEQANDFQAMTLRGFWIKSGRRHVRVALDGEVRHFAPPLHFRSRAGGLTVIAPPSFRATCRTESAQSNVALTHVQ